MLKVETIEAVEKRKRFKGTIESISDNADIVIKMEDTEYLIAFENISKAKIILTDEFAGICLMYQAIHGEEDKKNHPNPKVDQQNINNFN